MRDRRISSINIKNKPAYGQISLAPKGSHHLFVIARSGWGVVNRLLFSAEIPLRTLMSIHGALEEEIDLSAIKSVFPKVSLVTYLSDEDLIKNLKSVLLEHFMGTRVYVAGPEVFLWTAANIAFSLGVSYQEIHLELHGYPNRRVFCSQCRTIIEGVTQNMIECTGCRQLLFVRDHFSRKLVAYMGMRADGEVHGEFPQFEELSL